MGASAFPSGSWDRQTEEAVHSALIWYLPLIPSLLSLQYTVHIATLSVCLRKALTSAFKQNLHGDLNQQISLVSFTFVPVVFLLECCPRVVTSWLIPTGDPWAVAPTWSVYPVCPFGSTCSHAQGSPWAQQGSRVKVQLKPAGQPALCRNWCEGPKRCNSTAAWTPWQQQCPQLLQENEEL